MDSGKAEQYICQFVLLAGFERTNVRAALNDMRRADREDVVNCGR